MTRTQTLSLTILFALTVSACGSSSSPTAASSTPTTPTAPPASATPTVTNLVVTGNGCSGGVCVAPGPIALTATAQLSNGTTQTVTSQAQWSSTYASVATVNSAGAVTVLSTGDADIIATYQGRSAGQTIRVPAPWTVSGANDTVFDMPSYIRRVRITGSFPGRSSNFIVHIGAQYVVNELLGTSWGRSTFEGTYVTSGGAVEITHSAGVNWTFTQVR
jgi:hypothetical protein